MSSLSLNLLLADDSIIFQEGVREILRNFPQYRLKAVATDGQEAIDKCMEGKFDLVIMDIAMPEINGIEATRFLKQVRPMLMILMLSMSMDYATVSKAFEAGADGYMLKSEFAGECAHAIRTIQNKGSYLSGFLMDHFNLDETKVLSCKGERLFFQKNLITSRQLTLLKMKAQGLNPVEMAEELQVQTQHIEAHFRNMLIKTAQPDVAALMDYAKRVHII